MNFNKTMDYVSPQAAILNLQSEQVICASNVTPSAQTEVWDEVNLY